MPNFDTPFGTVEAPSLDAAQKWLANKRTAASAPEKGGELLPGERILAPSEAKTPSADAGGQPPLDTSTSGSILARLFQGFKMGWGEGQTTDPVKGVGGLPSRFAYRTQQAVREGLAGPGEAYQHGFPADPQAQVQRTLPTAALFPAGKIEFSRPAPGRMVSGQQPLPPRNPEAARLLEDFKTTGVPPNIPTVGQGRAAGLAAQVGRMVPGSPVQSAFARSAEAGQAARARSAAELGTPRQEEAAGIEAQNALNAFAKNRSQAEQDYGEFWSHMQGAPPAQLPNTVSALQKLMGGRFKDNPGLRGLFTNPRIRTMFEELNPRTVTIPQQTSPIFGPGGQPIVTRAAQTVQRGGQLPIEDLKELRSHIGYLIENPGFTGDDIPKGQLRSLYGALTKDLKAAALKQGRPALDALNKATANYAARQKVLERLEPLIRGDIAEGTWGGLNRAASEKGGANARLLQTVKESVSPQTWGDIGASVVRGLGRPTAGQRDILSRSGDFSFTSFVTHWNNLSDRAKDLLFGPNQRGNPRVGLEALANVAQAHKNVGKLANTSHSAEVGTMVGVIGTIFTQVLTGNLKAALAETGAVGGYYGLSKLLMSPKFATWVYQLPRLTAGKTIEQAVPQAQALLLSTMTQPDRNQSPQDTTRMLHRVLNGANPQSGSLGKGAAADTPARRIQAQRRVSEIQSDLGKAKRIGDLTETRRLMAQLQDADAEYRRLRTPVA